MLSASRLLLPLLLLSAPSAHEPVSAFARLKALAGKWEAKTEKGATIRVSYRLVSNDTVLVQDFRTASGKETLTVFHSDGPRLLATHYCAQGNQPRLRLDPGSNPGKMVFTFADATNLASPSMAHMVRLEVHLEGPESYTE